MVVMNVTGKMPWDHHHHMQADGADEEEEQSLPFLTRNASQDSLASSTSASSSARRPLLRPTKGKGTDPDNYAPALGLGMQLETNALLASTVGAHSPPISCSYSSFPATPEAAAAAVAAGSSPLAYRFWGGEREGTAMLKGGREQ